MVDKWDLLKKMVDKTFFGRETGRYFSVFGRQAGRRWKNLDIFKVKEKRYESEKNCYSFVIHHHIDILHRM